MSDFIERLRAFNRKERFYLVGFALDNPAFELGANFRALLGEQFKRSVPPNAFVAMDYHISWLYAAAVLSQHGEHHGPFIAGGGIELGNQEDVDLLVASERTGRVCYGMEIDPHYVDVAVMRWEAFTAEKAIREP